MRNRKRDRSPDPECDECLPISKRITRLNLRASRQSDDSEPCNHTMHPASSNNNSPVSPEVQLAWQQRNHSGVSSMGNNNNINYLPCGTSQCDHINAVNNSKNGLEAYAVHHGIPREDLTGYKPELSNTENPHYYQINSVLYRAHLEKVSRIGMEMKQ
ncbi:hypothetical protein ACF0H5_001116 [Mactra antiquata]